MLLIVVPDASLSDVYPCGGGLRRGGRRGERAGGRGRGSLGEGECAPRVLFLYQRAARPPRRVLWSLTTTRGGGRAQRGVASGGAWLGLAGAKGWGREADLSVVSTGVREKKKCGPTRARCAPPAPIFSSLPLSTPRPFTKIAHATGTTPRPSSPPLLHPAPRACVTHPRHAAPSPQGTEDDGAKAREAGPEGGSVKPLSLQAAGLDLSSPSLAFPPPRRPPSSWRRPPCSPPRRQHGRPAPARPSWMGGRAANW